MVTSTSLPQPAPHRPQHLPGSPAPLRAQEVQPWLSVCSWNGDSEPTFSFKKPLRSIFALSLQFAGNWQGWTAQHLQIHKPCRKKKKN